jgi:hypothetical protein
MPGFIQIRVRSTVTANVGFDCTVFVTNASPGDVVTIRLAQTAGLSPPYSARADVPIASDGTGVHTFQNVILHGPCNARLVADDIVSAVPLASDDAHFEVVP